MGPTLGKIILYSDLIIVRFNVLTFLLKVFNFAVLFVSTFFVSFECILFR